MIDYTKEEFYLIYQDKQGDLFLDQNKVHITGNGEKLYILEHLDGKRLVTLQELVKNYIMFGSL